MIDAHLHPQMPALDRWMAAGCRAAREVAGVDFWIGNATGPEDWSTLRRLSRDDEGTMAMYGLHPWKAAEVPEGWQTKLESLLLEDQRAGIGEIGLDRSRRGIDEKRQESVFRQQLEIAVRLQRPVTLHCVRADGWMSRVLRSLPDLPSSILIHGWAGSEEQLEEWIDFGAYLSVSGLALQPERTRYRKTAVKVPLNRLLIESDAPHHFGVPEGEVFNEADRLASSYAFWMRATYVGLARLREISFESLIKITNQNLGRFLSLPEAD
ncbi:MAG: TatD family hydrolase [Puniceicoccaceae bacterium]